MKAQDLSKTHGLAGRLFSWPESKAGWDEYRLTKEQVQQYEELGYVSGIKMLDERQIAVLKEELAELSDPKHPGNSLCMNIRIKPDRTATGKNHRLIFLPF